MDQMTPDEKAEINAKLDKIIEAIYGNGKPGMVTRLALLEQWQHNMEAQFQRLTAIAVGLGTTLFLGLVGFMWALLTHTVEIVPK